MHETEIGAGPRLRTVQSGCRLGADHLKCPHKSEEVYRTSVGIDGGSAGISDGVHAQFH